MGRDVFPALFKSHFLPFIHSFFKRYWWQYILSHWFCFCKTCWWERGPVLQRLCSTSWSKTTSAQGQPSASFLFHGAFSSFFHAQDRKQPPRKDNLLPIFFFLNCVKMLLKIPSKKMLICWWRSCWQLVDCFMVALQPHGNSLMTWRHLWDRLERDWLCLDQSLATVLWRLFEEKHPQNIQGGFCSSKPSMVHWLSSIFPC